MSDGWETEIKHLIEEIGKGGGCMLLNPQQEEIGDEQEMPPKKKQILGFSHEDEEKPRFYEPGCSQIVVYDQGLTIRGRPAFYNPRTRQIEVFGRNNGEEEKEVIIVSDEEEFGEDEKEMPPKKKSSSRGPQELVFCDQKGRLAFYNMTTDQIEEETPSDLSIESGEEGGIINEGEEEEEEKEEDGKGWINVDEEEEEKEEDGKGWINVDEEEEEEESPRDPFLPNQKRAPYIYAAQLTPDMESKGKFGEHLQGLCAPSDECFRETFRHLSNPKMKGKMRR